MVWCVIGVLEVYDGYLFCDVGVVEFFVVFGDVVEGDGFFVFGDGDFDDCVVGCYVVGVFVV